MMKEKQKIIEDNNEDCYPDIILCYERVKEYLLNSISISFINNSIF